ncbi:ABC transporter ATP-binding protein [Acidobacteriota bacterium]
MTPSTNGLISLINLRKTYRLGEEEVRALDGVTFDISHNEFVAIMGPSGSGKSTLLNLLGCLDTPTEGEYYLNGKLVSSLDENELAQIRNTEIGFVFQVFNLLPRATAMRNVELPLIYKGESKKKRLEETRKALEMVEMGHRMSHRPSELSGGERQRVAIARALVNNPAILLADEPTGNLDSKTGQEILNLFHKIHSEGNTIIMVTHDHEIAQKAQRILFVRDGRIEREDRQKVRS